LQVKILPTKIIYIITYNLESVVNVPKMGDSITSGSVKNYTKSNCYNRFWIIDVGDYVELDEIVAYIETDKITVDIRSPEAG
jgi:2-oxoglutarate dehydrogenase E2 component (dihydrolipoamide succinyltransferase)